MKHIDLLSSRRNNTLILISSKPPSRISIQMQSIPGLYIICQDGLFVRLNASSDGFHRVSKIDEEVD